MRNLKRALSLTLASVMLLGMMVLGTSAASYPDVDDNDNVEAIEVLKAVGVMSGSNSGNFNPDGKVTRIEMAIVMANLLDLNVDYFQGQNQFSDVPEWASGYVNACAASGIVTGVGGGRFGTGNVTATQAALMMLKALGYFQYNSDFNGDWARATALQASRIRLFEDIDAQDNTQLTRNQVAQLALNALEATMVDAEDNTLSITGGAGETSINVSGGQVKYIVRASRDRKIATAISATENSGSSTSGINGWTIELGEQLYGGDLKKTEDDIDDFGRPSTTWNYKNDKVGTFVNKGERIATFTGKVSKGNIYDLLSSTVRNDLTTTYVDDNGNRIPNASFRVYVDGTQNNPDKLDSSNPANYWERNSSVAIYTMDNGNNDHSSSRNGTLTEVFVDDDNNVTITITNTYVFQATADYNSSRDEIRVTPVGDTSTQMTLAELTISGEDFDVKDIKADDYLLITATKNSSGTYDAQSVAVAEKVTGAVDSYNTNDSVTIAGKTYKYSAICWNQNGNTSDKGTTYTVGQDAIVVLDAYGNIIAVDEARSSSSFVFVNKFGSSASTLDTKAMASVYFTDGTSENVVIKQIVPASGSPIKTLSGMTSHGIGWYNYSKSEDGQYTLYDPSTTKYPGGDLSNAATGTAVGTEYQLMKSGQVRFLYNNTASASATSANAMSDAMANDKTIIIVRDSNGDVGVYNGSGAVPDVKVTPNAIDTDDDSTADTNVPVTVHYLKTDKDYVEFAFVDLYGTTGSVVGGDESASFLFLLKENGPTTEGNSRTYYRYDAVNEDGNGSVELKFDQSGWATTKGTSTGKLYYKARTNSNEEITNIVAVPDAGGTRYINRPFTGTVTYDNGTLNIGGNAFRTNSDSKIVVVNTVRAIGNWEGDNWKISNVDGRGLAGMMTGWSVTSGTIGGATVSTSNNTIDELYVYIGAAVESDTAGRASIDSLTINGTTYTSELKDTVAAAKAAPVNGTSAAVITTISAAGEGNMTYAIELNDTDGNFVAANITPGTTVFSTAAATTDTIDVIRVTATPVVGGTPVTKYLAVKIAKTDKDPGAGFGAGVTDASDSMKTTGSAGENATTLKGMEDGLYKFSDTITATTFAADIAGNLSDNLFFKWKTTGAGTASARLIIEDSEGNEVYRETNTFSAAAAGEGHFFYVQVIGSNLGNAGTGSMRDTALTAGTYTWRIENAANATTNNGTFTVTP